MLSNLGSVPQIVAAAAMTLSLFYLMQSLIASSKQELDESANINIVDFT
jgi:hypothetical protein